MAKRLTTENCALKNNIRIFIIKMKKIFLFLFCVAVSVHTYAQQDSTEYMRKIAELKKRFAPDSRSVYFRSEMKEDTLLLESSSEEAIVAFTQVGDFQRMNLKVNLLPDKSLGDKTYGVANLSVTNNRKTPGNAAELVTQMLLGTPVEILKKERGYYIVRTPDGYLSYIDSRAISPMNLSAFNQWKAADKIIFTAYLGHAYTAPTLKSQRVSDLVMGNVLEVIDSKKGFYKVVFPDKREAYVQKKDAEPYTKWLSMPNPTADEILETAKTMIGVPYLWGGTSVKGVDCSGFTKTSYFMNGVVIPRDASQQALVGTPIDVLENNDISLNKCLKNLQAGDLLFFAGSKKPGESGARVTHTAIYMGNGEFIQAAGMVKISSLDPKADNYDPGQTPTLVSARRMLNNIGRPEITKVAEHPWYASQK